MTGGSGSTGARLGGGGVGGRFSRRGINVKWSGQARSCPITRHPVTANRGANNRRKALIASASAPPPPPGPIMATYWVAAAGAATAVRGDGVSFWVVPGWGGGRRAVGEISAGYRSYGQKIL